MAGWGAQKFYSIIETPVYSKDLKNANVRTIPLDVCKEYYERLGIALYGHQICTLPLNGYPANVNTFCFFAQVIFPLNDILFSKKL